MRRFAALASAVAIVATSAVSVTTPAVASPRPAAPTAKSSCVIDLDVQSVVCAESEAAALRKSDATRASARASLVIARFWDGRYQEGPVLTATKSTPCTSTTSDFEVGWANLNDFGWNNRIESLLTYNQCDAKLHDFVGYQGQATAWLDRYDNLGRDWSNRATSIAFS